MNSKPSPIVADNFKLITGIGPGIERRLHEAGVLTFAQLAALEFADLAAIVSNLAGMSAERVAQQDWPDQARQLVQEAASAESYQAASAGDRQHDVSFTVKLLLNEDNSVRRTQLVDNRSKAEEQWAGWDGSRMVEFISGQAALCLPVVEPTFPVTAVAEAEYVITTTPESATVVISTSEPTSSLTTPANFSGTLSLHKLEIVPVDTTGPRSVISHDQPFCVQLNLDLTEVILSNDDPLDYKVAVYAKRLGGGSGQTIGEAHDTIMPMERLNLPVACKPLLQGTYRLKAAVTLTQPPAEPQLKAHLEGSILQVY